MLTDVDAKARLMKMCIVRKAVLLKRALQFELQALCKSYGAARGASITVYGHTAKVHHC